GLVVLGGHIERGGQLGPITLAAALDENRYLALQFGQAGLGSVAGRFGGPLGGHRTLLVLPGYGRRGRAGRGRMVGGSADPARLPRPAPPRAPGHPVPQSIPATHSACRTSSRSSPATPPAPAATPPAPRSAAAPIPHRPAPRPARRSARSSCGSRPRCSP